MRGHDHAGAKFQHDLPSPVGEHVGDALLTETRAWKYRQVLARRCLNPAVVVEDCFDPHNATAVVRTCDAFGIHRVHVVTGRNRFKINRKVSQGTHLYVDLQVHAHIDEAYASLRADGYRIFVSDLAAKAVCNLEQLGQVQATGPLAVVFGSEAEGVSQAAKDGADGFFLIPMQGFTESLNLSVSAAVTLYHLRQQALNADAAGDLDAVSQRKTYENWLRRQKGAAGEAAILADRHVRPGFDRDGAVLDVYDGQSSGGVDTA
jgi:tRNA (guanosine-2'-O-)-methyltransferase